MTQNVLLADLETTADAPPKPGASAPLNLKLGSPAEYVRLRALLEEIGYNERGVCARAGIADIMEYLTRPGAAIEDALEVCIKLFLEAESISRSLADSLLPPGAPAFLRELGLLAVDRDDPAHYVAPVSLYEVRGFFLVSDQIAVVAGINGRVTPDDVVYPAIQGQTGSFLEGMPTTSCERLLDVGSGTGIAALYAARSFAGHAWAVDITERATQACAFNAWLNGLSNVTALAGDLFAPVAGMTFDRIVAHPPYVPATENRVIFRDGGSDGEQLTRRIIQEAPDYLEPGGRLYVRCLATDRKGARLEQRVRELLGPRHEEFDVVLVSSVDGPPAMYYAHLVVRGIMTPTQFKQQIELFQAHSVENLTIGSITVERHAKPQAPVTLRRRVLDRRAVVPGAVSWGLAVERALQDPDLPARLLSARPVVSPHAELRLSHRMLDGQLRAVTLHASTNHPFDYTFDSTPGIASMLAACDGTSTVAEIEAQLKQQGALSAEVTTAEFLQIIQMLVSGGIIEIAEFALPPLK